MRLIVNFLQAISFVIVANFTTISEIGILSFLLTANAFIVASFDFGVGKKILLTKNIFLQKKFLKQVFRNTFQYIGVLVVCIVAINIFIQDMNKVFYFWILTIATERILDYLQLFLLSRFANGMSFLVMILRRMFPLVTLMSWLHFQFPSKFLLEIYIQFTFFSNALIILYLIFNLRIFNSRNFPDPVDSIIESQTKHLAFLSILDQYRNLDVILIMLFFGTSITGEYSLIARLFNPALLIISSVVTQIVQEKQLFDLSKIKSSKFLYFISCLALTFIFIFMNSKFLITSIYGYATDNMRFFLLIFMLGTLFHFLSGIIETQFNLKSTNRILVRIQIYIYGFSLLFTVICFAAGELRTGLCIFFSAFIMKLISVWFIMSNVERMRRYFDEI